MAESGNDYGWIIGLAFVFFVFILPILKKAADAMTGKKPEYPARRPGAAPPQLQKRGPMQEMVDEVEGYFRKTRTEQQAQLSKREAPATAGRKPREHSQLDLLYRERKQEVEERRRRKEEERRFRRFGTVGAPPALPAQPTMRTQERRSAGIRPVLDGEPEGLVVIEEPAAGGAISSLGSDTGRLSAFEPGAQRLSRLEKTGRHPEEEKEESFFDMLGEMPDVAKAVVLSEIFSPPISMQSTEEKI